MKAKANEKHFTEKLEGEKAKVEEAETQLAVVEEEFTVRLRDLLIVYCVEPDCDQNWTAKAEKFCARIEKPRPVVEVERTLASVQRALDNQKKKSVFCPIPYR